MVDHALFSLFVGQLLLFLSIFTLTYDGKLWAKSGRILITPFMIGAFVKYEFGGTTDSEKIKYLKPVVSLPQH